MDILFKYLDEICNKKEKEKFDGRSSKDFIEFNIYVLVNET